MRPPPPGLGEKTAAQGATSKGQAGREPLRSPTNGPQLFPRQHPPPGALLAGRRTQIPPAPAALGLWHEAQTHRHGHWASAPQEAAGSSPQGGAPVSSPEALKAPRTRGVLGKEGGTTGGTLLGRLQGRVDAQQWATTVRPTSAPGMPLLPTWQDHRLLLGPQGLRAWPHTHTPRASAGTRSPRRLCGC